MHDTHVIIDRLEEHIQLLLRQYADALNKNRGLQNSIREMENHLKSAFNENNALRQKLTLAAWNNGVLTDEEKKAFAKNIDHFVKEIDRCLALLRTTEQP